MKGAILSWILVTDIGFHIIQKFFDSVEIESTFYKIPSQFMVNNWNERIPENFRFAVVPKVIAHDNV